MFNWTTTTIINSLEDYSTDLPLVKVWEAGKADAIKGGNASVSGVGPVLKIKRDHTFEARYISTVYKATANNPVLCEMEIDCDAIINRLTEVGAFDKHPMQHGRLSFYVSLEGSEESIYANDWYQKGKPFSVGFEVMKGDDAEVLAETIEKNANKFGVVMYGKKVFDLTRNGGKLTLKGTHEYQRFKMAAVAIDHHIDEWPLDIYEDGVDCLTLGDTTKYGVFKLVERGLNGFGTYHQLVKDLRLPTAHHNKWLQLKEDEKPVVGAKYDQYIITYCAPSMANPGFTVVGQHNMSVTTHVFWVKQGITTKDGEDFESFLSQVANIQEVNTVTPETKEDGTTVDKVEAGAAAKTEAGKYSANHEQKLVHTEAGEDDKVAKA